MSAFLCFKLNVFANKTDTDPRKLYICSACERGAHYTFQVKPDI